MTTVRIASLHLYPVKALRAVDVERVDVEARGFKGDRRFMVVDAGGRFLTQRSHPVLATINARSVGGGLILSDERGEIRVGTPDGGRRRKVVVWSSEVDAAVADAGAGDWLSERVGEPADLVYFDAGSDRLKVSVWTEDCVPVGFADAFPVLLANTASLAALNRDIEAHGGAAVPMRRFRPNLVIGSDAPWAEDRWRRIKIGAVEIDLVKPSDRCVVTTTDQTTGARMGKEPLAALARLRRSTDPRINGVLFGVNAVPRVLGAIRVGDPVAVLDPL
jgi:hypothetical protein